MAETVLRAAGQRLADFASFFRVVVVNGPRQAGKTTLLRLYQRHAGGEFRTLDDAEVLRSAADDPVSFVRVGDRPLCIDEVRRGGDRLVRAIKVVVDENWEPGQFLLSGSTRFLTVPTLSESPAGRAGFIELWPLSMAERTGSQVNFVDQVFGDLDHLCGAGSGWTRQAYLEVITDGGFPEALRARPGALRRAWYDSYLDTVVQRDIRGFSRIQQASAMPGLLRLLAARSGSPAVLADLARSLGGLGPDTVRNYLSYLETAFLVGYARQWSDTPTAKVAKTPKAYLTDSGLAANLIAVTPAALRRPGHPALGGLVETFVFNELTKAAALADTQPAIRSLRDRDGREIDFILEARDGRVVAVEVKASASPGADATRHLRWLRGKVGDRLHAGVVLHLGAHALPHGDRILAIPLSSLWGHAPLP